MTLAALETRADEHALAIFGALHPTDLDGIATLVLLGPREPGFWSEFRQSPEYRDDRSHAMDRWSTRVIGSLADEFGATAYFPFDGPPHRPFYRWALDSGQAWQSPVQLLVHDKAGLFVSYRGALGFADRLPMSLRSAASPCDSCADKPCLSACPVAALSEQSYDVPACKSFLHTDAGIDCMTGGCLVRRACPISQGSGRLPEQSSFHMKAFL
ncbi:hypothetical protein TG4357_02801 [Thalassovita gelatinovora]|uniref:4Fe-4S ferredoxin-type domain-containing protein n=1 Tax=Thalassovita gelatinovora TaxID=53501 RepID=A0A0P1G0B9_THAGE|nr:hypothetical protein [Thalassovita gelatinovora]QIZ81807.1 ferredoxin [Thalassovita gelatinovora]CUH67083.1 hypothetical protein TG4357_02801 [Thalassovita gelatinovora]SEP80952.1 hypothetical protein SAMN04488043_101459 [Thalassovita gelatinovora]